MLWKPAWFGVKPELVLKAGMIAWAPLGEGNATVERAEPTRYRPDWGGLPDAAPSPRRHVRGAAALRSGSDGGPARAARSSRSAGRGA